MGDLYAKCINIRPIHNSNGFLIGKLTLNKNYRIIDIPGSLFIQICADDGKTYVFRKSRFKIIDWSSKFKEEIDKE